MASEHHDTTSNKVASAGTVNRMPAIIEQEEKQMPHQAAKIKLQLFPLDEEIRRGLEQDGHNPFLELILRPRKKIPSIINHLCKKWGSSSIAKGELMLFPFNIVVHNSTTSRRWTSSDVGICAGDVHAFIGSPDIFRLRYGWFSGHLNGLSSSPSLGCTEPSCLGRISPSNTENPASLTQMEVKSEDSMPCIANEVTNVAVEQTVFAESHLVVHNRAEVENGSLNPSRTSKLETEGTVDEKPLAEQFKYEDPRMQDDVSLTPLLWSDLSNISIGGLLSEASLQGRFSNQDSKLGGGRLTSQPAAVVSDSLDAFINQITCPQATSTLTPDMPSSILDAEDTCHSFAVLKPSLSSGKGFLTLGRRAFSELSNQSGAPRPFKCPKSEDDALEGATVKSADGEQKTDPLPCSGVFSNENSLGLSSIRWNDSLGPLDRPLTSRQIINDDSISIGGLVR